jgi:pimeloyl-ACP methyl ester carboxylesterase
MRHMFASNGSYDIYYDTTGDPSGRPLLLIRGLGTQCISWEPGLLDAFADAGFFVIRFDNRDVGLSTKSPQGAQYSLSDMADDAIAVLDAVGVSRAHVFGISLGGMIAQTLAIERPDRVASLTSVMSTTGDPAITGRTSPEVLALLTTAPPATRDEYIAHSVESRRMYCGPLYDEAVQREVSANEYDRCFYPRGAAAQARAVAASGDRTERLRTVSVPTTVIHGAADPLIVPAGGEATAAAIKDARLVILDDMGHNLPPAYWPTYVAEVAALADRADEH